jgi:hypothetical protein
MKAFAIALFLAATCVGCQFADLSSKEQASETAENLKKARLWNNGLPADGCDYRISLRNTDSTWTDYAPDGKSRALIEKFAIANLDFTKDYHGYKEVQIKGETNKALYSIPCGWGSSKQLPGISISAIQN